MVGAAYLIHRQTKKFGKGEREVPHHSQKAKKYYPAEDESKPRKVSFSALDTAHFWYSGLREPQWGCNEWLSQSIASRGFSSRRPVVTVICTDWTLIQVRKSVKPAKPRATLQPGAILIILAGRFRGKRVVLLKHLAQGVLLVTGPFRVNGVPLRRVNARYVIATKQKVDLSGIDEKTVEKVSEDGYFTRDKKQDKQAEEAFFKQGEKPEVGARHPLNCG